MPLPASPCVVGNILYVGDESGRFYAINRSNSKSCGSSRPRTRSSHRRHPRRAWFYFGSYDHNLYCVNSANGKLKWKFTAEAQVHCSPCVAGGLAVIAGCDGKVRFIDLATGKQRGAATLRATSPPRPPITRESFTSALLTASTWLVSSKDASIAWKIKDKNAEAGSTSTASVTPDAVVFSSRAGRYSGWTPPRARPSGCSEQGRVRLIARRYAGSTVFVGCDAGEIYGIDLATGRTVWLFKTGSEIKASPAISNGQDGDRLR